jgi:cellulose synthase/poly-beta-1,6-N-acetylglucosamine synthase-like glycosyltransferase
MAEIVFWASFVAVWYVYAGYPTLLLVWRRCVRRPVRKLPWEPRVSIIIAVHNEEARIARKIRNCLELDYHRDKLEIVISLDGPTDGTAEVVRRCARDIRNVIVVAGRERRGKAVALNRGVGLARGDVLVFTDARQRLHPLAIRELTANLADPAVGSVSGELLLLNERSAEAGCGVGIYWRYEKWMREQESEIHSMMGATGALYAIRAAQFRPLPPGTILDDVALPMSLVLRGLRAVFDPAARAYDVVSCCPDAEYPRKVRTLLGNFQLLALMPQLLLPWRNPVWFQFWSHKVGRLAVPYFLAALLAANLTLWHGPYALFLAGQVVFYALAFSGRLAYRRHRATHPAEASLGEAS